MEYLGYINALTTIITINDYIVKNKANKHFPILKRKFFDNTNLESALENTKIENFNRIISNSKNISNFGRRKYNKHKIYINYNKRENYKQSR